MPLSRREFLAGSAALALTACGNEGEAKKIALADIGNLDGTAMAEAVRRGDITAAELVEQAIQRIETLNPRLNFMASTAYEAARTAARGTLPEGPFKGVPFLLKDLIEYPGLPFRLGSRLMRDQMGVNRPPIVAAYEQSGLIVLGKTTTPEFGLTASTEGLLSGPTRNPWNSEHSPGGSSGGAAVAVAAGIVPFAHATDGGGSIRIPAAMCGLFGFKPSNGRFLANGRTGDFLSVDHCISRTVRDSAMLFSLSEATGEGAPFAPVGQIAGPSSRRLRIAMTARVSDGITLDGDVTTALQDAGTLCRELGHEVVDADLPVEPAEFVDHFSTLWSASAFEIASGYAARTGTWPTADLLEPWTLGLAGYFQARGLEGYAAARDYGRSFASSFDAVFSGFDAVLTPVATTPAPRVGDLSPSLPFDEHLRRVLAFAAFTPYANLAGAPAMSVPLAWNSAGLPIGLQFMAKRGEDALLLSLAYELESARPWVSRRPQIDAA